MMESFFRKIWVNCPEHSQKVSSDLLEIYYLLFSQRFLWSPCFYNTGFSCCFFLFLCEGGGEGGGGGEGRLWSGVHPYKHSWIFQKRLTVRIWDFLTFNIYYLGPFSQTFRSVSLFLWKLEPFCRGWLKKFCLVAKIQYFLPYLKTQVKS